MRNILRIGTLAAIAWLGLVTAAASASAADMVPVTVNAPPSVVGNSDFTASITIGDVVDLNALQYDILFDASLLRLDSISAGEVGGKTMPVLSNMISPGDWRVVQYLGLDKTSGSGTLSVLHFHVSGGANQSGNITLSNGILSGFSGQIPATWGAARLVVISAPVPSQSPGLPKNTPVPTPPWSATSSVPSATVTSAPTQQVAPLGKPEKSPESANGSTPTQIVTSPEPRPDASPVPSARDGGNASGASKSFNWLLAGIVSGAVVITIGVVLWRLKLKRG